MPDNLIQIRFLEAVKSLKLKFPVAEIAEKTGAGQPLVSTYLNSKRVVSDKFLKTFCEEYGFEYEVIRNGRPALKENGPEESEDFRAKYIKQLEKENEYLQDIVKSNLTIVLATVRTLSVRQLGVGDVVLRSLERIEKRKAGSLVEAADKEIGQIEHQAFAHDSKTLQSR